MMKFEIYILQKKSQDPKMYQEAMGECRRIEFLFFYKENVAHCAFTDLTLRVQKDFLIDASIYGSSFF